MAAVAGVPVQIPDCAAVIDMPATADDGPSATPGESPVGLAELQERLRNEFTKYFQRKYAAVAVRREGARGYLLCPWSDF